MGINFDAMPSEKPAASVIPKGLYHAKIEKAEIKQGKDTEKPPYMLLTLDITDPETNTAMGKLWDIMSESTTSYVQYKWKRLFDAVNIHLTGTVELKDLCKLLPGKEMLVDITVDEKATPPKSVVDIFSADIFYPLVETAPVFETEENLATPFTPTGETPSY